MRRLSRFAQATTWLIGWFLFAAMLGEATLPSLLAQANPPLIEEVKLGLPSGRNDGDVGRMRPGTWAPVYVKIKASRDGIAAGALRLVLEGSDNDDSTYHYITPVPAAAPNDDVFLTSYFRPNYGEVSLLLQGPDGRNVTFLLASKDGRNAPSQRMNFQTSSLLEAQNVLYLGLGSRLPGLRRALAPESTLQDETDLNFPEDQVRKLAFLDSVRDLPDRWFGYNSVDVVVLATSSDSYVNQLLDPAATSRRQALGEWIRRGGKLILAAGRNRQLVANLIEVLTLPEFDKQPLLNCSLETGAMRKSLPVLTRWCSVGREPPPLLRNIETTTLKLNARPDAGPLPDPVQAMIREAAEDGGNEEIPIVLQAGCGLGRVVVIAFDFDAPPFSTWSGQKAFWDKLETELLSRTVESKPAAAVGNNANFIDNNRQELGRELKAALEGFQEVPVISFGWVALFILIYIILVGPVDYLILKKVFKRLELTWITFPTIVLVISVGAYFTAYALKGDDLRINKIDVLELDLHGPTPQAYGTTWLTLFSPRIQSYTVGLQPSAPSWVDPPTNGKNVHSVEVTALEVVNRGGGGGSPGLFRRPYRYAVDASGIEDVAIPVWATRSFAGRWRAPITAGKAPIEGNLRHVRGDANDPALLGQITNRLPVELHNVVLLYSGKKYDVGTIAPGGFVAIDNLRVGGQGPQLVQWLNEPTALNEIGRVVSSPNIVKELLFHGPPSQTTKGNTGYRYLDQSWRLRSFSEASPRPQPRTLLRDEVVLLARAPSQTGGSSEQVASLDASPTQLWIGDLPSSGGSRPALAGHMVQDVYVRVFIPVRP